MKTFTTIFLFVFLQPLVSLNSQIIPEQKYLDATNIKTTFVNTGIFNRDITQNNLAGFIWPKSNPEQPRAIFTTGLTIAAKVNGTLRMASASYNGEYSPGYISNSLAYTDERFYIYKIYKNDNAKNNPDYANWGNMVPFGAPFQDLNFNGLYDPGIDKPGIKDASETLFMCITDGFPSNHTSTEGFGGGTEPLMAEVQFTAWSYNVSGLEDINFLKWVIINKSNDEWNGAIFSLVTDPDLGDATDDMIGCDTIREMGFCYNGDNLDGNGTNGTYGAIPPAVGISFLKTPMDNTGNEYALTSFIWTRPHLGAPQPLCELMPDDPNEAYNNMKGLKNDGTNWINANNLQKTRYVFSGDPESQEGWTEHKGTFDNCNGSINGNFTQPNPSGDRRMVLNTADTLFNLDEGSSTTIVAAQFMSKGSNNLNSVRRLKNQASAIQNYWQTISIAPISSQIPAKYYLSQNYPNPFNPSTKIRFDIPSSGFVKLTIYDISGKEVARLVDSELQSGTYEYDFTSINLSSGLYFYKLESEFYSETKKMILLK